MRRALPFAIFAVVAGCGSGTDNSISVNNMNPIGTVSGTIVDAATEMPIAGATVSLLSGGTTVTAMTDASGHYTLAKVPAGTFFMTISQMGYQTALVNDQLNGAVGNFPVADPMHTEQQIGLIPNNGMFTIKLVDDTGAPVPMIKVSAKTSVREIFYQSGFPQANGSYQVSATTGMDGTATFMGLPAYGSLSGLVDDSVTVTVPPIQMMGQYTFLGLTVIYHVNSLSSPIQIIDIVGADAPLQVTDSNIDYLKGKQGGNPPCCTPFTSPVGSQIQPGGPISVSFNQAIQSSSLQAVLLDKTGAPVPVSVTPVVSLNLLTLTPAQKLVAGARYNLSLHVVAAAQPGPGSGHAQAEFDATAPIFTAPPAGAQVTILTAKLATSGTATNVNVTFSEPIGFGLGQTGAIDCASFFEFPAAMSGGFNNDPNTPFQGEWKNVGSMPPQNLVCHLPLGVMGGPYMDVTQLQTLESSNGSNTVVTGFSDTWQIPVDVNPVPANGMSGPCLFNVACSHVSLSDTLHVIFARQTGIAVKRTDGTPVPNNLTSMITQ
jgi:hypothetical protein